MIDSLYIAESGLNSQKTLIDIISNNIANSNTPSYKKSRVSFVDLIYKNSATPGTESKDSPANQLMGAGSKVGAISKDFTSGSLQATQHPFDIAIQGQGFFEVTLPDDSIAYSRSGRLRLDQDGYLTTTDGLRLTANIQIAPDVEQIIVSENGEIIGKIAGEERDIEIGQLELSRFNNPEALQSIGTNLYISTREAGEVFYGEPNENGMGATIQGFTEMSNVSMQEEMVQLVIAQRGYQLNARLLQVSDQLLETLNNLRR